MTKVKPYRAKAASPPKSKLLRSLWSTHRIVIQLSVVPDLSCFSLDAKANVTVASLVKGERETQIHIGRDRRSRLFSHDRDDAATIRARQLVLPMHVPFHRRAQVCSPLHKDAAREENYRGAADESMYKLLFAARR